MSDIILSARGRTITTIPRQTWENQLAQVPEHGQARLNFMSEAHHQVRYFVVRELPRLGQPIPPDLIARELKLSLPQIYDILDDLEKNLVFLVRNKQGAVTWAFPITVDETPHHKCISSLVDLDSGFWTWELHTRADVWCRVLQQLEAQESRFLRSETKSWKTYLIDIYDSS